MDIVNRIIEIVDLNLGGFKEMGSRGSGNWGHKGRPGKMGGSAPGGGKGAPKGGSVKGKPFEYRIMPDGSRSSIESEAAAKILGLSDRDVVTDKHISKVEWEWVSGGAEDPHTIKQEIQGWYKSNPGVKEMRLLSLYNQTGEEGQSFGEWKVSPMPLWRGGRPDFGETFASFSHNKGTAEGFAKRRGLGLYKADVKPKDWVGVTRGGESEVFVPEFDTNWDSIRYEEVG